MGERVPFVLEIEQFVFQAELELGSWVGAEDKINRLVARNVFADKLHKSRW